MTDECEAIFERFANAINAKSDDPLVLGMLADELELRQFAREATAIRFVIKYAWYPRVAIMRSAKTLDAVDCRSELWHWSGFEAINKRLLTALFEVFGLIQDAREYDLLGGLWSTLFEYPIAAYRRFVDTWLFLDDLRTKRCSVTEIL